MFEGEGLRGEVAGRSPSLSCRGGCPWTSSVGEVGEDIAQACTPPHTHTMRRKGTLPFATRRVNPPGIMQGREAQQRSTDTGQCRLLGTRQAHLAKMESGMPVPRGGGGGGGGAVSGFRPAPAGQCVLETGGAAPHCGLAAAAQPHGCRRGGESPVPWGPPCPHWLSGPRSLPAPGRARFPRRGRSSLSNTPRLLTFRVSRVYPLTVEI